MVGVAQLAEHRVVAPVVVGSIPITHPIPDQKPPEIQVGGLLRAPVAQLDRAPDFESVGRRFESCRAYHTNPVLLSLFQNPTFTRHRFLQKFLLKKAWAFSVAWRICFAIENRKDMISARTGFEQQRDFSFRV